MTGISTTLTCPKCAGSMRSYERSGVTVDQCTDCRGIFLDRGELERLIDAEDSHYGAGPSGPGREPDEAARRSGDDYGRSGHGDDRNRRGGEGKRRGGFLGDLLDFG